LLVSSNVKLAWFFNLKIVYGEPSPSCCTKHILNLDRIQICWFLDHTTPETFDKTNGIMYQLLVGITIHMFS
jgi:hypothetical protein